MIKKPLTFQDLDGNDVTEDFYFHLSMDEILKMEIEDEVTLTEKIESILATQDKRQIISFLRDFLLKTVGQRDPNNAKKFVKTLEYRTEFKDSEAFSVLMLELFEGDAMAKFVAGVVPKSLLDKAKQQGHIKIDLPTLEAAPVFKPNAEIRQDDQRQVVPTPAFLIQQDQKQIEERLGIPLKKFEEYTQKELLEMDPQVFQFLREEALKPGR